MFKQFENAILLGVQWQFVNKLISVLDLLDNCELEYKRLECTCNSDLCKETV